MGLTASGTIVPNSTLPWCDLINPVLFGLPRKLSTHFTSEIDEHLCRASVPPRSCERNVSVAQYARVRPTGRTRARVKVRRRVGLGPGARSGARRAFELTARVRATVKVRARISILAIGTRACCSALQGRL